jgi:hypothetical protein
LGAELASQYARSSDSRAASADARTGAPVTCGELHETVVRDARLAADVDQLEVTLGQDDAQAVPEVIGQRGGLHVGNVPPVGSPVDTLTANDARSNSRSE